VYAQAAPCCKSEHQSKAIVTVQYLPAQNGSIDNFRNILKYNQNVRQFIRLDFRLKGVDFLYFITVVH